MEYRYPTARIATVRFNATQGLHELKLLDADNLWLPPWWAIYVDGDFFRRGDHPPQGAEIADIHLLGVHLRSVRWEKDDHGWSTDVAQISADG